MAVHLSYCRDLFSFALIELELLVLEELVTLDAWAGLKKLLDELEKPDEEFIVCATDELKALGKKFAGEKKFVGAVNKE